MMEESLRLAELAAQQRRKEAEAAARDESLGVSTSWPGGEKANYGAQWATHLSYRRP